MKREGNFFSLIGSFDLPLEFCPVLAALVGPVTKIFFPHRTLFQFICSHLPSSWAGSRAGSPVS
jgi:hypothetical protein